MVTQQFCLLAQINVMHASTNNKWVLCPTDFVYRFNGDAKQLWPTHYVTNFYNGLHDNHCNYCRKKLTSFNTDKNVLKRIWQNKHTGHFYRSLEPLPHFSPLEESILGHLLNHANQRQTYSQIIAAGWPDEVRDGVSNDCVYRAIRDIRKKIEINPSQPRYLLNWRGRPEGGYVLYLDGHVPRGL
jgi:prepilin-type processing-associated H-X9-DG protein